VLPRANAVLFQNRTIAHYRYLLEHRPDAIQDFLDQNRRHIDSLFSLTSAATDFHRLEYLRECLGVDLSLVFGPQNPPELVESQEEDVESEGEIEHVLAATLDTYMSRGLFAPTPIEIMSKDEDARYVDSSRNRMMEFHSLGGDRMRVTFIYNNPKLVTHSHIPIHVLLLEELTYSFLVEHAWFMKGEREPPVVVDEVPLIRKVENAMKSMGLTDSMWQVADQAPQVKVTNTHTKRSFLLTPARDARVDLTLFKEDTPWGARVTRAFSSFVISQYLWFLMGKSAPTKRGAGVSLVFSGF